MVPLSHGSQPGMALLRMLSFYHRTHAPENSVLLSLRISARSALNFTSSIVHNQRVMLHYLPLTTYWGCFFLGTDALARSDEVW